MIKAISYRNISNKVQISLKKICSRPFWGKFKLNQLNKDTVELSNSVKAPEVLKSNPCIIIGDAYTSVKDDRLKEFLTEYRAYDFQGYDNKFPNNYLCVDSAGDIRLKPHIYLKYVEVKPEFARQGVYSEAIKKLIEISKKEGCEGRITLDSMAIEGYDVARIPSPSLAHWKNGFRFAEPENNKIMEKVLRGELPPEDAPTGSMYLEILALV